MIDIGEARGVPVADGGRHGADVGAVAVRTPDSDAHTLGGAPADVSSVSSGAVSSGTVPPSRASRTARTAAAASDTVTAPVTAAAPSDVVSVPEAAGREALRRLLAYAQPAVAPGPVALAADGRVLFHVAPGGCEDLPELLDWLDWGGVQLDLVPCGPGGAPERPVEWLHPPDTEPPELIALLATIATACHRLAVLRGSRTGRDARRRG